MSNFYDSCFEEIKNKVEGNGARVINYDDVDRLVVDRSKFLLKDESAGPECYKYKYQKPRKTRNDKGIKKPQNIAPNNDMPEHIIGKFEKALL